jgi:hypothetical protein
MRSLFVFIRRRWRLITAIGLIVFVAVISISAVLLYPIWYELPPGGMSGTYAAADFDWRLTRKAKSAVPIIQAIDAFYKEHQAYPPDVKALAEYLPASMTKPGSEMIGVWGYRPDAPSAGYVLWQKLGWDPSLEFRSDHRKTFWVLEPGDGGPEKQIQLNP